MKILSLEYLFENAKKTFLRFPLSIICSLIASVIGIYLIEKNNQITDFYPYIALILTAAIGIPLYFCVSVFCEKNKLSKLQTILLNSGASIILFFIFQSFPSSNVFENSLISYIKYAVYNVTIHLLVSFTPFIFHKKVLGFWNYNKILFLRFLLSFLYANAIYTGISLALLALKMLFNIELHDELFAESFIFITGVFNTWFFLAGIPKDFEKLEEEEEFPKGLKIFTQYVLLPLLALYLLILYVYGSKILLFWNWPNGVVGYLIIAVAILGIFSFLLLYPYGKLKENNWINWASKIYYYSLFPLLIILFIALYLRLNDYGLTVLRYILFSLAIWLLFICSYFSLKNYNIKLIPLSLTIVLIFISFGPWGMFELSEKHQLMRLEKILTENKILINGRINGEQLIKPVVDWSEVSYNNNNDKFLSDSLNNEVYSILEYLDKYHDFDQVKTWFGQNMDSIAHQIALNAERFGYMDEAEIYSLAMGITHQKIYTDVDEMDMEFFSYSSENTSGISVKNFDYLIEFSLSHQDSSLIFSFDDIKYSLSLNPANNLIIKNQDSINYEIKTIDLINKLNQEYYGRENKENIPHSKMTIDCTALNFSIRCKIENLEFEQESKQKSQLSNISGYLLLKVNSKP